MCQVRALKNNNCMCKPIMIRDINGIALTGYDEKDKYIYSFYGIKKYYYSIYCKNIY